MTENKILLPHHEQQTLCTSRLPYRQGRKLTAVKVYTVTSESNHLLIFGVPSLNLRQETKALFMKFGKLLQFYISTTHATEAFTETYHAQYERIQSARIAKKMLDTKNFYGGCLHVCYAPEFETINEIRQKLIHRQKDVLSRLRNLEKDAHIETHTEIVIENTSVNELDKKTGKKLNMGNVNTFKIDNEKIIHKKRKRNIEDKVKQCYVGVGKKPKLVEKSDTIDINNKRSINLNKTNVVSENTEIIDCSRVDEEVVTNINECLNYNKFGNEVIRKIKEKPLNKITFNINKKKLL